MFFRLLLLTSEWQLAAIALDIIWGKETNTGGGGRTMEEEPGTKPQMEGGR